VGAGVDETTVSFPVALRLDSLNFGFAQAADSDGDIRFVSAIGSNMTNCIVWNNGSGAGPKTLTTQGPMQDFTYENIVVASAPRGVSFNAVGGGYQQSFRLKDIHAEEIRTTSTASHGCYGKSRAPTSGCTMTPPLARGAWVQVDGTQL
jgi:hypothetical protein